MFNVWSTNANIGARKRSKAMDIDTQIALARLRVCLLEIKKYLANDENIRTLKKISKVVKD